MRRSINFKLSEEDREYLKYMKESMMYYESEESGIFGNEDRYKLYKLFNGLEDWEKNLVILYSKYRSYAKVAARLNVQKSTTAYVIKSIIEKVNKK